MLLCLTRNNPLLLCVFTPFKYYRVVVIAPLRGLLFPASYEALFLLRCSSIPSSSCFSFKFSPDYNLFLATRYPTPNKGLHTGAVQRKAIFFGHLQWGVSALLPRVTLVLCRESRETKVNFTDDIHM